jgi:hypothetical protein
MWRIMVDRRYDEIDFSQNVELSVPPGSIGATLKGVLEFHRERGIEQHRGRSFSRDGRFVCRWSFADAEHAEAFRIKFSGSVVAPRTAPKAAGPYNLQDE